MVWLGALAPMCRAQDQVEVINDPPQPLESTAGIDIELAEIKSNQDAKAIISRAVEKNVLSASALTTPNFYCIIHVLKWKGSKEAGWPAAPAIDKQNWYVYHDGKMWDGSLFKGLRIYGSKNIALLYLHLNVPPVSNTNYKGIAYRVEVTKRLPAPLQNSRLLIELLAGAPLATGELLPMALWGGRAMNIQHEPADITVRAILEDLQAENGQQAEITKQNYVNERRYYWDVSAGLPVRSIKELEFTASDGTVRAKKVERQNMYAFFNFYPVPLDTEGFKFHKYPSIIAGVPITGKPLDRPIVGVGFLFNRAQLFVGVAFNKVNEPQTLKADDPASQSKLESDLKARRENKFVWGINVPIRQVLDALKAKN
jgi:hypothetical protein